MSATLILALPDERLARLQELAKQAGVSPEELAQARLEEWLDHGQDDFKRTAQYVLRKNAELYRRLA